MRVYCGVIWVPSGPVGGSVRDSVASCDYSIGLGPEEPRGKSRPRALRHVFRSFVGDLV